MRLTVLKEKETHSFELKMCRFALTYYTCGHALMAKVAAEKNMCVYSDYKCSVRKDTIPHWTYIDDN